MPGFIPFRKFESVALVCRGDGEHRFDIGHSHAQAQPLPTSEGNERPQIGFVVQKSIGVVPVRFGPEPRITLHRKR